MPWNRISRTLNYVGIHFTQTCNDEWITTHYTIRFHTGTQSPFTVNLPGCWFYFLPFLTVALWTVLWLLTNFERECHVLMQVSNYMEVPLSPTHWTHARQTHSGWQCTESGTGACTSVSGPVCHGTVSEVDTGPWCHLGVCCANLPAFMIDHCLLTRLCARLVFCCCHGDIQYQGYFLVRVFVAGRQCMRGIWFYMFFSF